MKKLFFFFAVTGWILSLISHVFAVAGYDVAANKIAMLKTRIVLQADSLYSYKLLDSVIRIFKKDSIVEYFLITDLEAPGVK
ncbi:MAG: hypothetical protein ABIQ40_08455 [Bacteroidia bacterium]